MADEASSEGSDSKRRRGAFPRIALEPVLQLVEGIHELGHGDPVRRRTAFEQINRSPDSSTSYALNAAANTGYGLVDGSKTAQYLSLTDAGARIAKAANRPDRLAAVYDVLFDNEYFAALVAKYADRPQPQDSIAIDYLQREHGLSEADAATCWTIAKENIANYGLYEESGGKRVILSREEALARVGKPSADSIAEEKLDSPGELKRPAHSVASAADVARATQETPRRSAAIVPQITFNIQVVLPVDGTPEAYDAIFASMAEHLLKRGDA
jgi:hypothetical protein